MTRIKLMLINAFRKHVTDEEYKACVADASKEIIEDMDSDCMIVLYDICKAICEYIDRMKLHPQRITHRAGWRE